MIQFNLKITKRRALMVIIVAISVMVIDSTIVKYIAFSNKEYPTPVYVSIFVTLAVVFVGTVIRTPWICKEKRFRIWVKAWTISKDHLSYHSRDAIASNQHYGNNNSTNYCFQKLQHSLIACCSFYKSYHCIVFSNYAGANFG